MMIGQIPIFTMASAGGTSHGKSPNPMKTQRIWRREILDPTKKGSVTHFDCYEKHFVQGEEYRDLYQNRKAAGHRIGTFLLYNSIMAWFWR